MEGLPLPPSNSNYDPKTDARVDHPYSINTRSDDDIREVRSVDSDDTDSEESGCSDSDGKGDFTRGMPIEDEDEDVIFGDIQCLFCPTKHESLDVALDHMKVLHGFDIPNLCAKHKLDQRAYICLVNYCRSSAKLESDTTKDEVQNMLNAFEKHLVEILNNEKYMIPVLADDGLLQYYVDESPDDVLLEAFKDRNDKLSSIRSKYSAVATKICLMNEIISRFRNGSISLPVYPVNSTHPTRFQRVPEELLVSMGEMELKDIYAKSLRDQDELTRILQSYAIDDKRPVVSTSSNRSVAKVEKDNWYFESYEDVEIHSSMLNDKARTEAYMFTILNNKNDFENKTVLDIGCGTGILSMFSAKAGAKRVLAVDNSSILLDAVDIINENGLSNIITCVSGRVEETPVLKDEKVDIIVSEWMGYFLLLEGMLSSVLFARDKFLKPDGIMFPDTAALYLVGAECIESHKDVYEKWDDVYGFKMSVMKKKSIKEPRIVTVEKEQVVTDVTTLLDLNLMTCREEDLEIKERFHLKTDRDCTVTSLVGYFETGFAMGSDYKHTLKTGPSDPITHWKQTVFHLPNPVYCAKGEVLDGSFTCVPMRGSPRLLNIDVNLRGQRIHYELI